MLLTKEKRIKYFGFDDFWFITIGCLFTSLLTDYLFNGCSFLRYPLYEAFLNWSISLFFSLCNWFIMRGMMIFLRKTFPAFNDHIKRISILFLTMVSTVLMVDQFGVIVLTSVFGDSYNHGLSSPIIIPVFLISTMILAIYEAIYFYHRLKKSVQEEEQSKQFLIQAQLDALRNQAQPHFLFNSLNTLRDIIDQDSKADAKQFVNKLSDVYRFILESGNANLIALREEIKFAKAYVHIQSERFGTNLKVVWDIDVSSLDTLVLPMSIQLLLENAIKHNVVSRVSPLNIVVTSTSDLLTVQNPIHLKSTQVASTKLGLENIKKRYSLISDKKMRIENMDGQFIVTIPLLKSTTKTKSYEHINH